MGGHPGAASSHSSSWLRTSRCFARHQAPCSRINESERTGGERRPSNKNIRLTSALILRNVATHSSLGRRCLQRYESHLASVALSNVESSRTVAQILYELTHQCI